MANRTVLVIGNHLLVFTGEIFVDKAKIVEKIRRIENPSDEKLASIRRGCERRRRRKKAANK